MFSVTKGGRYSTNRHLLIMVTPMDHVTDALSNVLGG